MQKSPIEWTDYTSNPIKFRDKATGKSVWHCEKVSRGCDHCYSETLARRYGRGERFARQDRDKYEVFLDEKELAAVQRVRFKCPDGVEYMDFGEREAILHMPRTFIGDMTDIFGEWVCDSMLDDLFATLACKEGFVFQILTKRADRMRRYFAREDTLDRITERWIRRNKRTANGRRNVPWPIPEIWLGVSVEDQKTADERIPLLLQTPAAVRFVSYEPALGPVDFSAALPVLTIGGVEVENWLDWVIVGGESGPGARPFDIQWARDTIAQCREAGVACFVKQLGSNAVNRKVGGFMGRYSTPMDHKGGSMEEWPEDLRVREYPA